VEGGTVVCFPLASPPRGPKFQGDRGSRSDGVFVVSLKLHGANGSIGVGGTVTSDILIPPSSGPVFQGARGSSGEEKVDVDVFDTLIPSGVVGIGDFEVTTSVMKTSSSSCPCS